MDRITRVFQKHFPDYILRKLSKPDNVGKAISFLRASDKHVLVLEQTEAMQTTASTIIPDAHITPLNTIFIMHKADYVYTAGHDDEELRIAMQKLFNGLDYTCCVCLVEHDYLHSCPSCRASLCTECVEQMMGKPVLDKACVEVECRCPVCRNPIKAQWRTHTKPAAGNLTEVVTVVLK